MWTTRTESLDDGRIRRVTLSGSSGPLSYGDVITAWRTDGTFRALFIDVLATTPYRAYYWETPPVGAESLGQPFECVLIESKLLADVTAQPGVFAEHFASAAVSDNVVAFPNLGQDAVLIAPCPLAASAACPHLAAFARSAPRAQQHALWQRVGAEIEHLVGTGRRVWTSTAGQGVFWLHVRLDDTPKYYNYAPYRQRAGVPVG